MVAIATGLGRTGLQDWLLQRVTALILAAYTLFLLLFFIRHHPVSYSAWQQLFEGTWMRFASVLAILSLCAHAWIGVWTVTTDYIKPLMIRLPLQIIVMLSLLYEVWWGIQIVWRV